MTDREKAVVEAYTGITMLTGEKTSIFYEYIAEKLGRSVYSHELADKETVDTIKRATHDDFVAICQDRFVRQKPLTLEEADNDERVCVFFERRRASFIDVGYVSMASEDRFNAVYLGEDPDFPTRYNVKDYGKTIRCWAEKPTEVEMKAAKWEDEDA